MSFKKARLEYSEIYITNVCNYSCSHCQSFNNFAFKGHQKWNDYKDEYKKLSEKLDIDCIQIIGGEPTLNPEFETWVSEISKLWPKSKIQIATNGTRLNRITNNIYNILNRSKGTLWITCHDISLYPSFLNFTYSFLDTIIKISDSDDFYYGNWKKSYNELKEKTWPECNDIDDYLNLSPKIQAKIEEKILNNPSLKLKTTSKLYIDKNGVEVKLDWAQSFVPSAIDVVDKNKLVMKYNSDPNESHEICGFKNCHQINKGKLYKCPLVSVLPDFLKQFNVVMQESDKSLIDSYKPLFPDDSIEDVSKFVSLIKNPIDQCKFCPSNYDKKHSFVGTNKK